MSRNKRSKHRLDRRSLLKVGLAVGGTVFLMDNRGLRQVFAGDEADGGTPTSIYDPSRQAFKRELFIPEVAQEFPLSPAPGGLAGLPKPPRGNFNDVAHGIAPEYDGRNGALHCDDWNRFSSQRHEKEYKLITEQAFQEIVPGVQTPVWTYRDANNGAGSGSTPGPTFVVRDREPVVVRNENHLTKDNVFVDHDVETSIHQHGGHLPAHSDGYPDFYVLAGEARDYYYPNISPRLNDSTCDGPFDEAWAKTTVWYHDHAMDITGFNVIHGLAGFYLMVQDFEERLAADNVLPAIGGRQDIGLAIQDQRFNADGTIFYDFLDHNGHLGDVFTVNGRAQPFHRVERRKYRLRILNASNARMYQLRLSTRKPMLVIGTDSWLLPRGIFVREFELAPGERQDVIVDFSNAPDTVYLENIMVQDDGRKADGPDASVQRDRLLKFVVRGSPIPNDVTIDDEVNIRPFKRIQPGEIQQTRTFRWERHHGAFAVNNRFFNPRRADAVPVLGSTERWLHQNNAGGWWHPIHHHLEGFQVQRIDGRRLSAIRSFNSDIVNLHGGNTAEVFAKFRTFTGPFVFHCHTIEHEDMRMMGVQDPQPAGRNSPLDGESRIDPHVSGVVPDCIELEEDGRIFFDVAGDVDRLADRGVGFPHCEFDNDLRGNQGREDDD